jgi:hypothetical protein
MDDEEQGVVVKYHEIVALWTRRLGIFTAVLVVATFVGNGVAIWQSILLRQSNEETRLAFVMAQRPSVSIEANNSYYVGWDHSAQSVDGYSLGYAYQNEGLTPAINVQIVEKVCVSPCSGNTPQDLSKTADTKAAFFISPKSDMNHSQWVPISDIEDAAHGKKRIFLILYIQYRDVFSSQAHYYLEACDEVTPWASDEILRHPPKDINTDQLFGFSTCQANNMAN